MKSINHNDPEKIKEQLRSIENMAGLPAIDLEAPIDQKLNIRVNESVSPGMFKPDPLIPGGYMANSLTIRALRKNLFVAGNSLEDLSLMVECSCGKQLDAQFWKLCPYCSRELKC